MYKIDILLNDLLSDKRKLEESLEFYFNLEMDPMEKNEKLKQILSQLSLNVMSVNLITQYFETTKKEENEKV